MLRKSKLNVECKKEESRVRTQMTNTKCWIDCAKYDVKWNIEFWRKRNAIVRISAGARKFSEFSDVKFLFLLELS